MKLKKQLLAVAITSLTCTSAWATNGYAPHGIGQKAKGMGGAGVAYTQDTLAGGINPAGMVLQGNSMDLGIEIFRPIRWTTVSAGNGYFVPAGKYDGSAKKYFLVPEFGYNRMISNDMSVGVSVFGNGGMNTGYKAPLYSAFANGANTGINLAQLFVVPTVSWKLNENHSVGIGLNLAAQQIAIKGVGNFARISSNRAKLTDNGNDRSYGAGVRVGWIGKVSDTVTLGATYQTRTYMSKFDKYAGLFAEQGDFDIPSNFAVGLAVAATPRLTVAFDVMRINYGEIKSIANINNSSTGAQLGTNNGPGFGWNDQTVYKLGFDYKYSDHLTLRAGFNHAKTPIPSTETAFNVLAPATVEDHLTLGATWALSNGMEVTASYMHAFENSITGTGGGTGFDLSMYQDSLGIAVSWDM